MKLLFNENYRIVIKKGIFKVKGHFKTFLNT